MSYRFSYLLRSGTALGLVVGAANLVGDGAAQAQEASVPADASQAADSGQIEEIVVTANKRAENIQKVPIAITAVTGARLESIGITNTQDLVLVVPGLKIQNTMGGTAAHLRGVGTTAIGAGTENSVATYIDNIYIFSMSGALVQLNNIAQVEVLKGPQGTLFGRNATGGVISIRTKDPKHEPGGDFNVSYGNYDTVMAQGYLTAGITEDLAADIAGFVSLQGDGWGKNRFSGKDVNKLDQYAVRSKWLYEPGDRDQFRLIGDFSKVKGSTFNSYSVISNVHYGPGNVTVAERASRLGPDGLFTEDAQLFQQQMALWGATGGAAGLAPFAVVGNPFTPDPDAGFYDTETFIEPKAFFRTGGGSFQWDHDFGSVNFTSITAYRRAYQEVAWNSVPAPAPRSAADWHRKEKQFSQEFQLKSAASSNIQWVAGLYYLNATAGYPTFNIRGTALGALERLEFQSEVTTKTGAAFGQVTAPLWEGAHLTGGLRYTIERRGNSGTIFLHLLPAFGGITIPNPVPDAHKTFRKLTWRVAFDQQVTPEILAYASYNRGFKSGLYNSIPPGGAPIQPEVLDAFEAGLKTDLLDRKLRLNIASFYYKYKNLQVTVFTPTSAILQNGAAAEVYGVDLDLTAKIGSHLTLFGGASLIHSEFTSYPDAGFFLPQPVAANGLSGGGTVKVIGSAKGNKLPYAPDFTFNVGANYKMPIGDGGLEFDVNYGYTSRWYSGPDNIRSASQRPYGLLDGSATYTFPGDHFSLGLWARNITKEKYYVTVSAGGNPGGYEQGLPGAPRTYGVRARYKF